VSDLKFLRIYNVDPAGLSIVEAKELDTLIFRERADLPSDAVAERRMWALINKAREATAA
jgi:hypothetical protein